ncbi:hypothetical protein [Paracoccus sp. S1E-3]|uniref:hypothetical protein n=1 Tax=Paracoccus sp. S1E-3 TaxID=2756130 RepID=UPI0015EEDD67|nr:hypothetical protein [Paracoccus sp. S1E-3]MBA4491122.1 hypothetical protein [Paracoccus sp. S1E-3]
MKALLVTLVLCASPAIAADPDWPCQSPKRPALSIGQMWVDPAPDATSAEAARRPDVAALATRLASRKLPVEELTAELDAFAASADNTTLTGLFEASFDQLEGRRRLVVAKIDEFTTAQRAMQDRIGGLRDEMARLEATQPPDYDAIDLAEERLDLNTRMFRERQDQIRYVCDVPNLIEQRAFAISREIQSRLK